MNNFDVLVIGRSCLDVIAVVNQFPLENQKLPLEFRLTEGGGQGGTASCCISRLGGKVAYVGKLGDDIEGKLCLKRLADYHRHRCPQHHLRTQCPAENTNRSRA